MRLLIAVILAGAGASMEITSPAFTQGSVIPRENTCEGADKAPALHFAGAPSGTQSLALVVHDPDAPDPKSPQRDWVHWVVYDLPPGTQDLPAGGKLPSTAREGKNDFGKATWGGPCPPIGRHRYFFDLYALDTMLPDLHQPSRAALDGAMKGHILARAEIMGTYQKGD